MPPAQVTATTRRSKARGAEATAGLEDLAPWPITAAPAIGTLSAGWPPRMPRTSNEELDQVMRGRHEPRVGGAPVLGLGARRCPGRLAGRRAADTITLRAPARRAALTARQPLRPEPVRAEQYSKTGSAQRRKRASRAPPLQWDRAAMRRGGHPADAALRAGRDPLTGARRRAAASTAPGRGQRRPSSLAPKRSGRGRRCEGAIAAYSGLPRHARPSAPAPNCS
jgi:hypothetical protein